MEVRVERASQDADDLASGPHSEGAILAASRAVVLQKVLREVPRALQHVKQCGSVTVLDEADVDAVHIREWIT